MPDLNGIEFAQKIKLESPALPVVLLTGWGDRAVDPEALHGAVNAVLGKPVSLEGLLDCVETCCRNAEAGPTDSRPG
jgi:FixJ family two-component response regulator